MINFDELRATNTPFTASASNWSAYLAWCDQQVCRGCGARYVDRPRDVNGYALDTWVTETECWRCFKRRCAAKRAATMTIQPILLALQSLQREVLDSDHRPSAEEIAARLLGIEAQMVALEARAAAPLDPPPTSAKKSTRARAK